jgi:hypothetical protein
MIVEHPLPRLTALAMNVPRKRFFRSEIEQMGYYHRGDPKPEQVRYYLSVDRAGDMLVVLPWAYQPLFETPKASTRFQEFWRPWQVNNGLWFWGVA